MDLDNGGHLTHGSSVNFSGKLYDFIFYGLDKNGLINYKELESLIRLYQPNMVLAGASAYSRIIDYQRIKDIIDRQTYYKEYQHPHNGDWTMYEYKPYFMVDMAHVAGLIAAGDHPSPFGLADIITTTTHKTLRGPRGGMIFCKPELAKKIDSAIFPGSQGGPLQHIIAAKAICAEEACTDEFKEYIHQVVKNSKAMAQEVVNMGYDVVTGGTDNHMFLLDLTKTGLTGKQVQDGLDKIHITFNKNCVPNETRKPSETSGVRIGTAAMTTKGFK
jgi:glycine hydroxymethyltransferase